MKLTDEEKQTCRAWAEWVLQSIRDELADVGVEHIDDDAEAFDAVVVHVLEDIAASNARRVKNGSADLQGDPK